MAGKAINITGNKYSYLTVLARHGSNQYGSALWYCKCDCGNNTLATKFVLDSKHKQSCGCLQKKSAAHTIFNHAYKHGLRQHPLYRVWQNMKKRCLNPRCPRYKDYGGRGIEICQQWIQSSEQFIHWCLANGWKPGLTIDRENNDGHYEPSNCRFLTKTEQNQNKRKRYTTCQS